MKTYTLSKEPYNSSHILLGIDYFKPFLGLILKSLIWQMSFILWGFIISSQNPRRIASYLMHMSENSLSIMPLGEDSEKKTSPGWFNVNENKSQSRQENRNTFSLLVFYVFRTAGILYWLRVSIHSDPLVRDNSRCLRKKWGRCYLEEIRKKKNLSP